MASKKFDLAVKVGEQNGKAIWKTVGVMLEGEKGPYLLLDKTFNPAGVPSDRPSIMVNCFKPKDRDGGPPSSGGGGDTSTSY